MYVVHHLNTKLKHTPFSSSPFSDTHILLQLQSKMIAASKASLMFMSRRALLWARKAY